MSKQVSVTFASGATRTFKSQIAVARALSGNGTTGLKSTISRRVLAGGGYVGNIYVQSA